MFLPAHALSRLRTASAAQAQLCEQALLDRLMDQKWAAAALLQQSSSRRDVRALVKAIIVHGLWSEVECTQRCSLTSFAKLARHGDEVLADLILHHPGIPAVIEMCKVQRELRSEALAAWCDLARMHPGAYLNVRGVIHYLAMLYRYRASYNLQDHEVQLLHFLASRGTDGLAIISDELGPAYERELRRRRAEETEGAGNQTRYHEACG